MSAVLLCERFSFYLLVSLFVLYLNEHFGIVEGSAAKYFGYFIGISYFAPILGGALADRHFGYIRSAVAGSLFLALGYFLLGTHARPGFLLGLIAIATGQGLFKPSAMTIISNLYAPSDLRRDSAYSIAYLCSNLGALLSPIVGEALLTRAGGLGAFSAAGAMQLVGSLILIGYRNALTEHRQAATIGPAILQPIPTASPRERAQALTILSMSMMTFWLVYNQLNSTLLFWARDSTNRLLLGHEIPVPYFAAIPSVLVITVTPILLKVLASLRKKDAEPGTPIKLILGMIMAATSYLVLVIAAHFADGHRVSMLWLLGCFFFMNIAELLVSPMGVSLVSRIAPREKVALLMGLWFLSIAAGNVLSGQISSLWSKIPHEHFFGLQVLISLLGTAVLVTQLRRLRGALPSTG